jgi:hypothetical protein
MTTPPKRLTPLQTNPPAKVVFITKPPARRGHRVVIYGTGGIGKSSLSCSLPGVSAAYDLDESFDILRTSIEAQEGLKIPHLVPAKDWASVRTTLQAPGWEGIDNIILDSGTKLDELCVAHTLATVKHPDKGVIVTKIEDYGFGKGYQYNFEVFLNIFADLDKHVREGRNVVIICHDCTTNVPNPKGDDFLRYEPRLQNPSSGKGSIRLRMKEWADHVLFMSYDISVNEEGKATGNRTRTLYTAERPFCMAKSRTTDKSFDITSEPFDWTKIIK